MDRCKTAHRLLRRSNDDNSFNYLFLEPGISSKFKSTNSGGGARGGGDPVDPLTTSAPRVWTQMKDAKRRIPLTYHGILGGLGENPEK